VLGEADLDLSLYHEDEVVTLKLSLRKCADPDAFIEVGMKAYDAEDKSSARRTSAKKPKEKEGGSVNSV